LPRPPTLDIYIGYDRQEVVAYHTLCQSIVEATSHPVRFTPISPSLGAVFRREAVGV
jgi:hypothetical protein